MVCGDESNETSEREPSTLELRAIATRALALGDTFSRALLRDQLEAEEFQTT